MKPKKVESTAFGNRDERRFGFYMYNSQAGGTCRSGFSFSVTGPGGNTFNNHNHYVADCCFVVVKEEKLYVGVREMEEPCSTICL